MDTQAAVTLHKAGRRPEAEIAYRAALAARPDDGAALGGLGVLRYQAGDPEEAAALLARARKAAPPVAEYAFNLGLAEFRRGRLAEAEAAFTDAGRLDPRWPLPPYELGRTLIAQNRPEAAVRAYRTALRLQPDFLHAEGNLANGLKALGKTEQAIAAYRRILRRHPGEAEIHHNLAAALREAGDQAGAEAGLREAIRLRPDFTAAQEALARLLLHAGRTEAALPFARAASRALPDRSDLAEMLGDANRAAGLHDAAIAAYTRAAALAPVRHSARFGMAEAMRKQGDFAAAEAILRALVADLRDAPAGLALAQHDLGNVLRDQGRFADAEAAYRASLAQAETPLARNHLAAVLRDLGRLEEAEAAAKRGLAQAPDDADLRYNLAITLLTAGRWREGFGLYEGRFAKYRVAPTPGRAWTGQDPRGRIVMVEAEQGLGDTLHFLRYVPTLAERGARVVLRVPRPLLGLLAGFPGADVVVDKADPPPAADFHVPIMSLPHRLGEYEPCPMAMPYLAADPACVAVWRGRVAALPGVAVGLVWRGNPGFQADHLRSVPAASLAPLGAVPGIRFVSLQKGASSLPPFPLADWTEALGDMAATAALIAALDLVVSVDTAVAHLAGAMGKPVWLLNRFDTCWRWGAAGDRTCWYPAMRLFRQATPGDWSEPLRRVATELAAWAPGVTHGAWESSRQGGSLV